MKNFANEIAASMDAYLQNKSNFEVAFTKKASANNECECCAQARKDWKQEDGCCDCANKSNCSKESGCNENCSCNCNKKTASDKNSLVKSAFDKLMSASNDLEAAGFEVLSANALVLVNHLVVEAKAKSKKPDAKEKAKEKAKEEKAKMKAKEEKEKAKLKAKEEKDKNEAKDKKEKAKFKAKQEKEEQLKKLEKLKEKSNKGK